jgi:glycosyltransferase involved in cell wall biosynthesis
MYGLTVLIVTWNRPKLIRRTLDALQTHLRFSGTLNWRLADDGSEPGYVDALLSEYKDLDLKATVSKRRGWGGNVNRALHDCLHPCVFLCEDDYVARRDLDLDSGVALLNEIEELGMVRYDGLDGHCLSVQIHESALSVGRRGFLVLDPKRSKDAYSYSNRPHLAHLRFHAHYGPYPEGKKLGETEDLYAWRVLEDPSGPKIACLYDGLERAFDHEGKSWQERGF